MTEVCEKEAAAAEGKPRWSDEAAALLGCEHEALLATVDEIMAAPDEIQSSIDRAQAKIECAVEAQMHYGFQNLPDARQKECAPHLGR